MQNEENFKILAFEEKYQMLNTGNWTREQLKQSAEQVEYMCICKKCPSYQGTEETESVFCTMGKSQKIQVQKGCLCKECPLFKMMSARWEYYCTQGSAYELSDLNKK
ncbi:MAG: DUF2769 domain-containing protein [Candidatus Ranarchaeia archaeon]